VTAIADHYAVLGVPPTSTRAEIRHAYVVLARRHHPDHAAADDAAVRDRAVQRMRDLNEAWRVLGDQDRRRAYDRTRRRSRPADDHRSSGPLDGDGLEDDYPDGWGYSHGFDEDEPAADGLATPLATALKVLPFVVLVLFVVGVFVYSAYATGDDTSAAGSAVQVGGCVLVDGDAVVPVPCSEVNDGQVVEVSPVGGMCRNDDADLLAVGGDGFELCVVPTLATRD